MIFITRLMVFICAFVLNIYSNRSKPEKLIRQDGRVVKAWDLSPHGFIPHRFKSGSCRFFSFFFFFMDPFFTVRGETRLLREALGPRESIIRNIFEENEFSISELFNFIAHQDKDTIEQLIQAVLYMPITISQNYWTQDMVNTTENFNLEISNFSSIFATFLGTNTVSRDNTVPPFANQCPLCHKAEVEMRFSDIDNLKEHLQRAHSITDPLHLIHAHITESGALTTYCGIRVDEMTHEDTEHNTIVGWYCRAPGCTKAGRTIEEYLAHQWTHHNDKFIDLHPLWANILRHIEAHGDAPTLGELFTDRTLTHITFETRGPNDTGIRHDIFHTDARDTDRSLEALRKDEEEDIVHIISVTNYEDTTSYSIVPGSQFMMNITAMADVDTIPQSVTTPISRTLIDIQGFDEVYESVVQATIDDHTEHADNPINEQSQVISTQEGIHRLSETILSNLMNANTTEQLNTFISEIENIAFDIDVRPLVNPGGEFNYTILQLLDDSHSLPRAGCSSPYTGETTVYESTKRLKHHIIERETWTNGASLDIHTVYNYPITGEGRWRGAKRDGTIITDETPHFCCFLDCEYFTTATKCPAHEKNGKHAKTIEGHNLSEAQLVNRFGYFWGPQIAYAWKHNALAPFDTTNHQGEMIYICHH